MYEGLYDTQKGLSKPDAKLIGALTGRLLLQWDQWVHRRVERATFCDENVLRRSVSVDFTLPHWFHYNRNTPTDGKARQLVPLGFLRKGVLVNFSLQSESGVSLPLLTAPQNAQVAEATLQALAQSVLGRRPPRSIRSDLRSLVRDSPAHATETHYRLFMSRDKARKEREVLNSSRRFVNAAALFRDHFLALSMLTIGWRERRVLHLSYEDELQEVRAAGKSDQLRRMVDLAVGRPRLVNLEVPAANQTDSYHLEVEAPDGLMVSGRESFHFLADGTAVERRYRGGNYRRAHFHFTDVPPGSAADVTLYLMPRRSTIMRGATLTSAMAGLAVGLLAWRVPGPGDSEVASATLLALLSLIGLVVMRSGEGEMATTLLFPLRALAVVPAALAMGAALFIVGHFEETALRIAFVCIACLIACATALLANNWRVARAA